MAKFYGEIGYLETVESDKNVGVMEEKIVSKYYRGELLRNTRKFEPSDSLNDNININNYISIIPDKYAFDHFFNIRFVRFNGCAFKVTNVEIQNPRILLTIGGVYNEP